MSPCGHGSSRHASFATVPRGQWCQSDPWLGSACQGRSSIFLWCPSWQLQVCPVSEVYKQPMCCRTGEPFHFPFAPLGAAPAAVTPQCLCHTVPQTTSPQCWSCELHWLGQDPGAPSEFHPSVQNAWLEACQPCTRGGHSARARPTQRQPFNGRLFPLGCCFCKQLEAKGVLPRRSPSSCRTAA